MPCGYETVNGIEDQAKFDALVASMTTNGWQGAPVVVWGDQAVTGSHRLYAAEAADIRPEVITIDEVCEEAGTTLAALIEEADAEYLDWYQQAREVRYALPAEIVEKYGIDIDG